MVRWLRLLPPVLIAALGLTLAHAGAPPGVIAMICGMFLVPYLYLRLKEALDARARRAGRHESMLEDWTLLAVSLVFCAGAVLTMRSEWRTGVVIFVLFGAGVAVFAAIIRRKLLIRGIGAFMALVGVFLLLGWAAGLARQFLRFEPEGLVFGLRRVEYRVPWDSIAGIRVMDVADSALVFLEVADVSAMSVTPPRAQPKVYRNVRKNGLCIMPAVFGMDTPPLLVALERYIRDPQARAELAPRAASAPAIALPQARLR